MSLSEGNSRGESVNEVVVLDCYIEQLPGESPCPVPVRESTKSKFHPRFRLLQLPIVRFYCTLLLTGHIYSCVRLCVLQGFPMYNNVIYIIFFQFGFSHVSHVNISHTVFQFLWPGI